MCLTFFTFHFFIFMSMVDIETHNVAGLPQLQSPGQCPLPVYCRYLMQNNTKNVQIFRISCDNPCLVSSVELQTKVRDDFLESLDFSSFIIFSYDPWSLFVSFCQLFKLPLVVQCCDVICEWPLMKSISPITFFRVKQHKKRIKSYKKIKVGKIICPAHQQSCITVNLVFKNIIFFKKDLFCPYLHMGLNKCLGSDICK